MLTAQSCCADAWANTLIAERERTCDAAGAPLRDDGRSVIGGGRDRFYDRELFEETARLIPGCVLVMHPERGHITVLSDPRAVAQIRGFLYHDEN